MAKKQIFFADALTGGGAGALDAIDGNHADMTSGAVCFTTVGEICYIHKLDTSSSETESSPHVIEPDDNPGTKRWILYAAYGIPYLGDFRRSFFEYKDADEIYIEGGWYHVTDGTDDKIVRVTSELTFQVGSLGSNGDSMDLTNAWHYIYIDYSAIPSSNILTAASFLNHTTAPTWNVARGGYYGTAVGDLTTDDRCIFAVYGDDSSPQEIEKFYHEGNDIFFDEKYENQAAVDIDTVYTDIGAFRAPAFTKYVLGSGTLGAEGTVFVWRPNGSASIDGHYILQSDNDMRVGIERFITDSNHIIEVKAGHSNTATIAMNSDGWSFPPIGM